MPIRLYFKVGRLNSVEWKLRNLNSNFQMFLRLREDCSGCVNFTRSSRVLPDISSTNPLLLADNTPARLMLKLSLCDNSLCERLAYELLFPKSPCLLAVARMCVGRTFEVFFRC